MSELLKSLVLVSPLLQQAFLFDCMVGVTDRESFLAYHPSAKLNLGIKHGDRLRPGSINATVVSEGRKLVRKIPKDVYGIAYIAVGVPIIDHGQVVGCLATGVTTDQEDKLRGLAEELTETLGQIALHTERLASDSAEWAQASQILSETAIQMERKIAETSQISQLIKEVSSRSNILGLNAMLEAARAGSAGRGFSVVAKEIRDLSSKTSASSQSIFQILDEMNRMVNIVSSEMEKAVNDSLHQSTRIQELYAVMRQLQRMSEELKETANMTINDES
ncbi:MAG: methyl-accepting chemotaxis protein [Clostridia bacterium]